MKIANILLRYAHNYGCKWHGKAPDILPVTRDEFNELGRELHNNRVGSYDFYMFTTNRTFMGIPVCIFEDACKRRSYYNTPQIMSKEDKPL